MFAGLAERACKLIEEHGENDLHFNATAKAWVVRKVTLLTALSACMSMDTERSHSVTLAVILASSSCRAHALLMLLSATRDPFHVR